jgi:hypothetical protein
VISKTAHASSTPIPTERFSKARLDPAGVNQMEQSKKQNLPNVSKPNAGPGEHPEKHDRPEHEKHVPNAAKPSAGVTGKHADCDQSLGEPDKHGQNQSEFDIRVSPDSVVQELRKAQLGSNRLQGN